MRTTVKVRGKVNTGHVKKRYQAGRDKSLDRIGSFTMQAAKKQFLNRRPRKTPKWRKVGERDGVPVVEVTFRPVTAGRVTSWKTGRGRAANGFLRSSVRYERDDRRGSVVIGPAENTVWLNKIQEFGGSRAVSLRYLTKRPIDRLKNGPKVPKDLALSGRRGRQARDARGRFARGTAGEAYVVTRRDAMTGRRTKSGEFKREAGKIKPGRYMAKGLDRVRPRIPKAFTNFVQGP